MSELDQHTPDDFWRKTFDEAAETPPPRVWNEIERRLDDSDEAKILPLWGTGFLASRPFMWGAGVAAAVALLLVGWWLLRTPSAEQPMAQRQRPQQPAPATSLPAPALADKSAPAPAVTPTQPETASVATAQPSAPTARQRRALPPTLTEQALASALSTQIPHRADVVTAQPANNASVVATYKLPVSPISPAMVTSVAKTIGNDLNDLAPTVSNGQLAVGRLTGRPMQRRDISEIQRIVWFRPAELPVEPATKQSKQPSREVWASVSMMPGAFDPSVSLRSSPTFAANSVTAQTSARTVQSAVNSRANFSVAYQTGGGVQLSEHWSIESGVGYLAGRSTVESPTFQAAASAPALIANADKTQATNSLYVDALRSSSQIARVSNSSAYYLDNKVANSSFNALYDVQQQQSLTNDYQYIQVPVQLGYQLRPRKKLGLAVLGGLLTNVFVRNTVGDDLVVTSKDGVYRPVSWAASMGARLRYRSSRRWSASLAGIYQPSLGPASQPASRVQTRPTSAGMSFGIDYHFN